MVDAVRRYRISFILLFWKLSYSILVMAMLAEIFAMSSSNVWTESSNADKYTVRSGPILSSSTSCRKIRRIGLTRSPTKPISRESKLSFFKNVF